MRGKEIWDEYLEEDEEFIVPRVVKVKAPKPVWDEEPHLKKKSHGKNNKHHVKKDKWDHLTS